MIIPAEGRIEFHLKRLVDDASAVIHVKLPHNAEAHLVHVLATHLHDTELMKKTAGEEYIHSMRVFGRFAKRELCLRAGNICLLFAGLFPEITHRRNVSLNYYVSLGQVSYEEAGVREEAHRKVFYDDLVKAFVPMVNILAQVRQMRDRVVEQHVPMIING